MIIIKRSIHQEDITILNVYATNNEALKYMKEKVFSSVIQSMCSDISGIKLDSNNRKISGKSPKHLETK